MSLVAMTGGRLVARFIEGKLRLLLERFRCIVCRMAAARDWLPNATAAADAGFLAAFLPFLA